MNCEIFKELLPEYLDETLTSAEMSAARQHLQVCAGCQQAVLREQAFAKSLQGSFKRETEGLCLSAETRRNILKAMEAPPRNWLRAWKYLEAVRLPGVNRRWATLAGATITVLLVVFGIKLYRGTPRDATPMPTTHAGDYALVIDVPMRVQTYVFRQQDKAAVDTIHVSISVGHAAFVGASKPSSKTSSKPL